MEDWMDVHGFGKIESERRSAEYICILSVGGWAGLGWVVSRLNRPSTLDGLSVLVDIDRSFTLFEWTIDVISRL